MKKNISRIIIASLLIVSCQTKQEQNPIAEIIQPAVWNIYSLNQRANENLDPRKWDTALFKQDIETYEKFQEVFQNFPLNKSPFPVAEYDYAVSYIPFTIEKDGFIFKGVRIGEAENPESETFIDKLTLLVLSNDINSEETTLVESRNYPYLTAQGYFRVSEQEYDWVFSASPDGFSTLLVNMKLFDLRFGETIIIYPQVDKSFLFHQLKESTNSYKDFDAFKEIILNNEEVKKQLKASTDSIHQIVKK